MKNEDKILNALQLQITSGRFKSLNELASFLGLTDTTKSKLYNVFNRDMNAGYKTICDWFDKLDIPLIINDSPSSNHTYSVISQLSENSISKPVIGTNIHHIPVYEFTGIGEKIRETNEPIAYISILPEYNFSNMYPLKVSSDSMHPAIPKDSFVGICPYTGILQEGGVYLVEKENIGRILKRIKLNSNGELTLFSDNLDYDSIPLDKFIHEGKIIGRVMWVLRLP